MTKKLTHRAINSYLRSSISTFDKCPAATRYEKGYKAALDDLLEFIERNRASKKPARSAKTSGPLLTTLTAGQRAHKPA